MRKFLLVLSAATLTFGVLSGADAATAKPTITKLIVKANGANEMPISGAKAGSATGTFILNSTKNTFCFTNMKIQGIPNVFGAHIHLGAFGIDGSIFISFDITKFGKAGQFCTKADHLLLLDIAKYPSDYYFNVHTKAFPSGAVRGQLKKST